jgi:putative peptidoglycan lipid II flippase
VTRDPHLRRLGAAALLMTSAVFLSRIIGYLRDAVVAAKFGAKGETDAFFAAFTIPDWLNYLVAGGTLSISLLPIYARHLAANDEREANRVLSMVTTVIVSIVLVGVVAGELLARPLSAAFLHRMDASRLDECVRYTRILLPAQLCFVAGGLFTATLFARGHFRAAALAPLVYNAGIIVGGLALGDRLGPAALAWGALGGAFVGPFLVPTIAAIQAGARLRPSFAVRHPDFIAWVKMSLPLMLGVSLVTADDWILRYFGSGNEGAISHLAYAKRLVAVPIAVAGQAVGQASMPFFTRLFAEGKRDELADTVLRTLRGAGVIAMLAGAGMVGLAEPLVSLLFRRGHFGASDVSPTAVYLAIMAAVVPLWSLQGLISRAFYAARDTLTPMLAGTIVTVISLPVYGALFRAWGPTGLALGSSAGIFLHTIAVAVLLPRLLPELRAGLGACLGGLARGALLAAACGAAAWSAARGVDAKLPAGHVGDLARCAVGGAAFLVVLLALSGPLGVPEPGQLVGKLRQRLVRRAA